jgi:hypothetical protein
MNNNFDFSIPNSFAGRIVGTPESPFAQDLPRRNSQVKSLIDLKRVRLKSHLPPRLILKSEIFHLRRSVQWFKDSLDNISSNVEYIQEEVK